MNEREINPNTPNDTSTTPRPWIEPAFERVVLQEAMSTFNIGGGDGGIYQS